MSNSKKAKAKKEKEQLKSMAEQREVAEQARDALLQHNLLLHTAPGDAASVRAEKAEMKRHEDTANEMQELPAADVLSPEERVPLFLQHSMGRLLELQLMAMNMWLESWSLILERQEKEERRAA